MAHSMNSDDLFFNSWSSCGDSEGEISPPPVGGSIIKYELNNCITMFDHCDRGS